MNVVTDIITLLQSNVRKDHLSVTSECHLDWVIWIGWVYVLKWMALHGRVVMFPRACERSSNMHGNRGGSLFDRAGRGLHTPHRLFSIWSTLFNAGSFYHEPMTALLHFSYWKLNIFFLERIRSRYQKTAESWPRTFCFPLITAERQQSWEIFFFFSCRRNVALVTN